MKYLFISVILFSIVNVFGKAKYYDNDSMVSNADFIVIVEIEKVEKVKIKPGEYFTCTLKATASVKESIKGNLKGQIEILGGELFECAQCNYKKGKYLLFLKRTGKYLTGFNWDLGIREISNGTVLWEGRKAVELDNLKKSYLKSKKIKY